MRWLLLLLLLALASAAPSAAQPNLTVYAGGGVSLPTFPSNFRDFYRSGPHLGLGVGGSLTRRTRWVLSLQFSRYGVDGDALRNEFELVDIGFEDGALTVLSLTADLVYDIYPERDVRLYALIGAGAYNNDIDDLIVTDSTGSGIRAGTNETVPGLNGGVGVELRAGATTRVFLEPRYSFLFTNKELLFITDKSRHVLHLRAGVAVRL